MDTRERLRELVRENPALTAKEAQEALGISRQRLYTILKGEGLSLRDARRTVVARSDYTKPPRRVTNKASGCISELAVALDLLGRGFDVYKSMSVGGMCDLVVVDRETANIVRVEVKTSRRAYHQGGKPTHGSAKFNSYDVLALFFPDEQVIVYEPPEPLG